MITVLGMVRTMLNSGAGGDRQLPTWLKEYPVTLTQVLFYLYHNVPEFMPAFMTGEVLTALVGTLFPTVVPDSSAAASPVEEEEAALPENSPGRPVEFPMNICFFNIRIIHIR